MSMKADPTTWYLEIRFFPFYGSWIVDTLRTEAELASVKYPDTNELPAKPGALGRRAP